MQLNADHYHAGIIAGRVHETIIGPPYKMLGIGGRVDLENGRRQADAVEA